VYRELEFNHDVDWVAEPSYGFRRNIVYEQFNARVFSVNSDFSHGICS